MAKHVPGNGKKKKKQKVPETLMVRLRRIDREASAAKRPGPNAARKRAAEFACHFK